MKIKNYIRILLLAFILINTTSWVRAENSDCLSTPTSDGGSGTDAVNCGTAGCTCDETDFCDGTEDGCLSPGLNVPANNGVYLLVATGLGLGLIFWFVGRKRSQTAA